MSKNMKKKLKRKRDAARAEAFDRNYIQMVAINRALVDVYQLWLDSDAVGVDEFVGKLEALKLRVNRVSVKDAERSESVFDKIVHSDVRTLKDLRDLLGDDSGDGEKPRTVHVRFGMVGRGPVGAGGEDA